MPNITEGYLNELVLFAGIGGGLLGTHQLGLTPVCAVERDLGCRVVLMRRQNQRQIPTFPIWDDVCTFAGERWRGTVDIVSGGFPCQAFSTAARGRNNAVNLWPEMFRIISEVQPSYVFAENVSRKAINEAARDCASMGYKTESIELSAADLGADHIRKRYWLLAYADNKSKLQRTVNAKAQRMQEFCEGIWETYTGESGVVDGLPSRVDRFRMCGNGQVPAVAATALWTLANA